MIRNFSPVSQALLGTLFTWGLTAAGAALVFILSSTKRKVLDGSLGFAAGVMTAASYWSLLSPAIELAEKSGSYGENGEYAFIPAVLGFILGAIFIYGADILMPFFGVSSSVIAIAAQNEPKLHVDNILYDSPFTQVGNPEVAIVGISDSDTSSDGRSSVLQRRRPVVGVKNSFAEDDSLDNRQTSSLINSDESKKMSSWKRILLLLIAITVHNIPEGLAVGVGFGAVDKTESATFESARNLAVGIGIQNFPEGLAVSLPLKGAGYSSWKSFWYGQLSGMVEPVAGVLGAVLIGLAEPILPYALAFAAGAMIYVVVDDIIPEANTCGNGRLASWGAIVGFAVMMSLDVGLG